MLDSNYRRLLRTLLLPINFKLETKCVSKLKEFCSTKLEGTFEEHELWIESQIEEWRETRTPSNDLKLLINKLLLTGNGDYKEKISENYFACHKELTTNQLLTFEMASSYLSHLLLIIRLADEDKMSCAQIAVIMLAMNPSVTFERRSLQPVLAKLKVSASQNFGTDQINELWASDNDSFIDVFGDASFQECIDKVSNVAISLGYSSNLQEQLVILSNFQNDISKYVPYIQILHYQCSIIEYHDHLVRDFYEFSPRGVACKALLEKYPDNITNASNPFLNNAKSVSLVDMSWAASKKQKEYEGALALFHILSGMDRLGYSARKELAQWLRFFIHRFLALAKPLNCPLPESLTLENYQNLISNIAKSNTGTKGILEQRVVDSFCLAIYDSEWVSRGIGDAVNASNLSKKKLGDCDFQNYTEKKVHAYEAHGGLLTQSYLDEHVKTLPKLIKPRLKEWRNISISDKWSVEIKFVAHDFNAKLPETLEVDGVVISIEFMTYAELFAQINLNNSLKYLNDHFLSPLSESKTPAFVRSSFLGLI